jgi:hypothetical protein
LPHIGQPDENQHKGDDGDRQRMMPDTPLPAARKLVMMMSVWFIHAVNKKINGRQM